MDERRRQARLDSECFAPIWDGNETWLVVTAVILWEAFPVVYATFLSAFYLPLFVLLRPDLARSGVRVSEQDATAAMDLGFELHPRFPDREIHVGDNGPRFGGRDCRVTNGEYPAVTSAGSRRFRSFAVSACAWLRASRRLLAAEEMRAEVRDLAHRQIPILAVAVLAFLLVVFA